MSRFLIFLAGSIVVMMTSLMLDLSLLELVIFITSAGIFFLLGSLDSAVMFNNKSDEDDEK